MSDRKQSSGRNSWKIFGDFRLKVVVGVLALCVAGQTVSHSFAAEKPKAVLDAVRKALDFLKKNGQTVAVSEVGLVAYTCLSAGESPDDPFVRELIGKVLMKVSAGGYAPSQHGNYEAGVDAMALAAADKDKYKDKLQIIANYLIKNQMVNGSWDYVGQDHGGDTSISQYGMLGLWAAARAGIVVPQKVLDQSAGWHLRTQFRTGSWGYQPLGGDNEAKHSMTVAGAGSLGIARLLMSRNPQELESLGEDPEAKTKKVERAFGVLDKVVPMDEPEKPAAVKVEIDETYKPQNSSAQITAAMKGGLGWVGANYSVDKNVSGWHLYYMYGLERAASLANQEKIAGHDWYTEGYRVLLRLQTPTGAWNDLGGEIASTCFAVLFLVRATEKLLPNAPPPKPIPKANTFGGGVQAGGRGLPTEMANVSTKDGNVVAKKLDTPLDKLLAELENPKFDKIESAQAAIVEAVQVGQREQLIGQKDLLLKLAKDTRVDVRRTAFWALGRCNDLRTAPVLIQGLMDVDFDAAVEARNALCVLSRRPRGFGLPEELIEKLPATATQAEKDSAFEKWRDEDVRRWRAWYQTVRPYSERDKLPD